jgi:hypothetical protein
MGAGSPRRIILIARIPAPGRPMIASNVFQRADDYARQFAAAQPFRHVSIDGFFDAAPCTRLLDQFPAFSERHAVNEMGLIGNKAVRTDVGNLDAVYSELDAQVRSPAFLELVSRITGIPDLLYDPDYIGGGTHENRDGQALSAHVDFNILPGRRWHRRLNLIVYLNPEWEEAWGGCIELHSDPWTPASDRSVKLLPLFNRCVIFETNEHSWHGFEQIRLPADRKHLTRKSFAIYLYTAQRPEVETVAPHATVYVPRGMPTALAAGDTLTHEAHADLAQRFAQLLGQMKFLYQRELEFSAHVESLAAALEECRAALRLDLEGHAVQPGGSLGLWPDGWIGPRLRAKIRPTRPAATLSLTAWAPPGLPHPQRLAIRFGGAAGELLVPPDASASVVLRGDFPADQDVALEIDADQAWQPPGDARALAWRPVRITLDEA